MFQPHERLNTTCAQVSAHEYPEFRIRMLIVCWEWENHESNFFPAIVREKRAWENANFQWVTSSVSLSRVLKMVIFIEPM
jgi:hypothetical protein